MGRAERHKNSVSSFRKSKKKSLYSIRKHGPSSQCYLSSSSATDPSGPPVCVVASKPRASATASFIISGASLGSSSNCWLKGRFFMVRSEALLLKEKLRATVPEMKELLCHGGDKSEAWLWKEEL